VGDKAESMCSQVTATERLLHETLTSINSNILRLIRVALKREEKLPARLRLLSCILIPSCVLFLQLLSRGSADVPVLQAEVTQAREVVIVVEVARVMVVLATETSA
jgi:hypothetical protein